MTSHSRVSLWALGLAIGFTSTNAMAESFTLKSPDGQVSVSIDQDKGLPTVAISYKGQAITTPSPTGLNLDVAPLGKDGFTVTSETKTVSDTYNIVVGKAKSAPDHYNQLTLTLTEKDASGRKVDFIVRAYDGGVAFRYFYPKQAGLERFEVKWELTQFNFAKDFDCWGANMGRFDSSFEAEYDPIKSSKIRPFHNFMAPLVCKTGEGQATFALAESDVKDFPGLFFSGRGDAGPGVAVTLPPRFDNDRNTRYQKIRVAKVTLPDEGFKTPWRVMMIGATPGALTQSSLIPTLAAPSEIKDTSWIKPAKTAWDWWNGFALDIPNPGINTASYKAYIDFAAALKLDGILIDEGWHVGSTVEPNPEADPTTPIAALDMPEILKYAKSKGLGVWVWVQWQQLDEHMDKALATYEKWGLRGIKVDFMNRNDQEMVGYYHRMLKKAAEHRLTVDLHGAYPPNGLNRTWPNYVTQEGVLGAENSKWSARITARHNVTLPFTRMILGPMDYTPGGFKALSHEEFVKKQQFIAPYVLNTRGQAIAMYVVYDSPLQMVSDTPSAYKKADGSWQDGAELISMVPATWDETRVVAGDIGEYIVTLRRSGSDWYIGAMTNEEGRTVTVPLDFLPAKGRFKATIWQDGKDMNSLNKSQTTVDTKQSVTLTLAPSGGAVVKISK